MSIKKIVVPTDFSAVAQSALNVAVSIAKKANAELHLLHVVHVPVIDPYTPAETINTIKEEEEKVAQQELAKLAISLEGIKAQIHVKLGFAVDEIVNFAEENSADLIVMGTTGASGVEEVLLGSNASGVAKRSRVPVLSIPDEMKEFATNDIVYATDLEKNDIDVVKRLVAFAKLFDSSFHVLHVHNDEMDFSHDNPETIFRDLVENTGYGALSFHQIDGENTRDSINKFISTMPCDILALATHHRSFFGKLFHSSLTKKMVNHSHIPVLSYYK